MNSLQETANRNAAAVQQEWDRLVNRLHVLEAVVGIEPSKHAAEAPADGDPAWGIIRCRIQQLSSVAKAAIDPDDPGIQDVPILYQDWVAKQERRSAFTYSR